MLILAVFNYFGSSFSFICILILSLYLVHVCLFCSIFQTFTCLCLSLCVCVCLCTPGVPWFWNDWGRENECSRLSPSPLYQSFNVFLRQRLVDVYGPQVLDRRLHRQRQTEAQTETQTDRDRERKEQFHVVIEVRKIDPKKGGARTASGRFIKNLPSLIQELRQKVPGIVVTAQDFSLLSFKEQIQLAHSADLLISMVSRVACCHVPAPSFSLCVSLSICLCLKLSKSLCSISVSYLFFSCYISYIVLYVLSLSLSPSLSPLSLSLCLSLLARRGYDAHLPHVSGRRAVLWSLRTVSRSHGRLVHSTGIQQLGATIGTEARTRDCQRWCDDESRDGGGRGSRRRECAAVERENERDADVSA